MSTENVNTPELQKGIDQREQTVIKEARFFEPYKKDLHELFKALNREDQWSDNPGDMLEYMRAGWQGFEHGNSVEKDQFTEEEAAAALVILDRMGLTGELLPEADEVFDQTLVVGGTTTANYRRFDLTNDARKQGTDLGTEIWLVGQRPRGDRDGTDEALLGTEGPYAGFDISDNSWSEHARKIIQETDKDGKPDDNWAFTETETARLAMLKVVDPKLEPHRIDLNLIKATNSAKSLNPETSVDNTVPARDITDYYFETDDGHEIILLNAGAADRGKAPSRHTTKSATKEWLERHTPEKGAKVLYVTGNPHSLRTTQDTYQILTEMGREDIQLVVAGTTPAANTPIQTYLGEVAKLIDNDWKRNYQDKVAS